MTRVAMFPVGRRSAGALLALIFSGAVVVATAEAPQSYRRILVPAESPATWPREGAKYLPVESREFVAWIAAANELPAEASITDAEYEARLDGQQLVDGKGRWQVALRGAGNALLPVDTSLVVHDAAWDGEPTLPARIGWWESNGDAPLVYGLQVPRAGALRFVWHTLAAQVQESAVEIPLRLPVAARSRLVLDLPVGKRPVMAGSVVLESPASDGTAAASGRRRWVIAVGPVSAAVLRLEETANQPADEFPAISVREDLRYEITNRGIDVDAKLRLDEHGSTAHELSVSLPPGLQLIAASSGDETLAWRVTAADEAAGAARAVVQLPTVPSGLEREVVLRAWVPLVVDRPRQLPKFAVDGAFWTAGAIELVIDQSLELRELTPIDCVQIAAQTRDTQEDSVRTMVFESFSPSGTLDLVVGHRSLKGHVRTGASLAVGNSGVDARLVAEVRADRGHLHSLAAELRPGWSISAVESVPPDALGEWYVEREQDAAVVKLQLNRAVTAAETVTLIFTGRWQRAAPSEPLALAELGVFQWRGLAVERNLVRLEAAEPYEISPVGNAVLLPSTDLSADDRRLFDAPVDGWLFDLAARADAAFELAPKRGTYSAEIQLDAALAGGRLEQTYRVECRPQGSGIEQVLVYLSEPMPEPPRWIDADTGEQLVAERMPLSDPRLGGLPPGGELWQLYLRRQYARPITITTTLAGPWPERRRVPLISLPDAALQQGRVSIASDGVELPAIVAQGMTPTPLPARPSAGSPSRRGVETRAVYRYQPTRLYDVGPAPELWLGPPAAETVGSRLLATRVELESHYGADGSGVHRVLYQLENHGAASVELELPAGMRLESAALDGQPTAETTSTRDLLPLPLRKRTPVLELVLRGDSQPLANGRPLASPLPKSAMTILDGEWTIWLPEEFEASGDAVAPFDDGLDWRQRLFGPLARPRSEPPFNPLSSDDWSALGSSLGVPTTHSALAAAPTSADVTASQAGWHAVHVGFIAAPPEGITIARPPALAAWALASFLVCLIGVAQLRLRAELVVVLAAAVAVISLFLPATVAPLATGAVLGLACSPLWRWAGSAAGGSRLVLFAVAAGMLVSTATGAAQAEPAVIHRVLVPVDATGQVSGTKYFVDEQFLRQLIETAERRHSAGGAWLLIGLNCEGELKQVADRPALEPGRWTLVFDVDVLSRDTTIRLPLVRADADWAAEAVVDGIPVPIAWDTAGRSCSVRVSEPGRCRLAMACEPRADDAVGRRQIALSLPPVTGAAVRVTCPQGSVGLSVTGATLARRDESTRTVWQGELDGSGRFTMSWPDRAVGDAAGEHRRVDQLLWLRIEPGGVELDAKFMLRDGGDWPESIDWLVDGRWELLDDDKARLAGQVRWMADGRQLIPIRPLPATGRQAELVLRFRLRDASPLGRLRMPDIELASWRVEHLWLAVTSDAAFECVPMSETPLAADGVADFLAAWGNSPNATPLQVVLSTATPTSVSDWILAVRPRPAQSNHRERLALVVERGRLRVEYEGEVTPQANQRFGWSLSVPTDLSVESVAVDASGRAIPLDWTRPAPDRVNIFCAETMTKPYRLQVAGGLPAGESVALPVPIVTARNQTATAQTVSLYRTEDMLASWQVAAETPVAENAVELPPPDMTARFVGSYSLDPRAAGEARIVISPNRPVVRGATLTALEHENGVWMATLTCQLRVEQGELDTLRLRVPATWSGPFEVSPGGTAEIASTATGGREATLSVRLPQPVRPGDSVQLRIRSPLTLTDGQLASAPLIVPSTTGKWQHFLALPQSVTGEPVAWTRSGLEPSKLPLELRSAVPAEGSREIFRVAADTFQATLRSKPTRGLSASIRLAETAVFADSAGNQFSATRLVIVPQGLGECTVELPGGEHLVRIALDGHPVLSRPLGPHRFQVQLGAPQLPQTLEIVTRSVEAVDLNARLVDLCRPVLMQSDQPIPVDVSLWSCSRPMMRAVPRVSGAATVSPAEQAALRLDRLVSISQSATRSAVESPVVDGYNWFANWAGQLEAPQEAARTLQHRPADQAPPTSVAEPSDDALTDALARLTAWIQQVEDVFADAELTIGRTDRASVEAVDPWLAASPPLGAQLCFVADGGAERLRIELVPSELTRVEIRMVALVSIALVAAAAIWLVRTPVAREVAQSWPQAVGVIAGLTVWVWLRPSALGLFVAVGSLALLVGRLAHARKPPRHDSTTQSNSIPEELAKP